MAIPAFGTQRVANSAPIPGDPHHSTTRDTAAILIDYRQGTSFSPLVRGQCPYRWVRPNEYAALWELAARSMARGVGGGLDADTYDWRDISSGSRYGAGGGQFTTLEFLQHARDHDAVPMITANMFGGGHLDESNAFVCITDHPEGLAADYVRYTNIILQKYRQGDEDKLTGEDLRVYNSIRDWGGKPKLLAPREDRVHRVEYWQIGNEPEVRHVPRAHANHYLSPTDYRERYKLMTRAMLAVDPTIKVGPCLAKPEAPNSQWLPLLAADGDARIDFVSYHPYDGGLHRVWADSEGMAKALRQVKPRLLSKSAVVRSIMNKAGRADYELIASEWNPLSWEPPREVQASMANAIAIVESCFTFAEDGMLAATFWQEPQNKLGPTGAFAGLVSDMGNILVSTSAQMGYDYDSSNFRIYVTRHADDDSQIMIWGLNFSESESVTIRMRLTPPGRAVSAILKRYRRGRGLRTLTANTDMAWRRRNVVTGLNTADFPFTMQPAEITVLVLRSPLTNTVHRGRLP